MPQARIIVPKIVMTSEELTLQLEKHLADIQNQGHTEEIRVSAKRAIDHLVKKEWNDIVSVLNIHLQTCLDHLQHLSDASPTRVKLMAGIANDRKFITQIMIEKHRKILDELIALEEDPLMDKEIKEKLVVSIARFKDGDTEKAREWLMQKARTHSWLGRTSKGPWKSRGKAVHRAKAAYYTGLAKNLET